MFDTSDDVLDRLIQRARRPVRLDPGLDARIMAHITHAAPPRRGRLHAVWSWLVRPRTVRLSPLAAIGAVTVVVAVVALSQSHSEQPAATSAVRAWDVQFALVARQASRVALVGDFNDWDPTGTPMEPTGVGGVWAVVVSLQPGRHRYAFLVDSVLWVIDPAAPSVPDDEFGAPSSVVTVGGSS